MSAALPAIAAHLVEGKMWQVSMTVTSHIVYIIIITIFIANALTFLIN